MFVHKYKHTLFNHPDVLILLSLLVKRVLILRIVLMIDFAPTHDYHTLGSMFGMYQ